MKRVLVNVVLGLIVVWFALLDHCVIVASETPLSREIVLLLFLQAGIGALLLLFANGAFPTLVEMATGVHRVRWNFIVFGIPLILFLSSPALISDAMYRARYGNDKFAVHAHVAHDLWCCLNPFVYRMPDRR